MTEVHSTTFAQWGELFVELNETGDEFLSVSCAEYSSEDAWAFLVECCGVSPSTALHVDAQLQVLVPIAAVALIRVERVSGRVILYVLYRQR